MKLAKKTLRAAAALALLATMGCGGESTSVSLPNVPPVTPQADAKKPTPAPKGAPVSPSVLPGANR